jgi:hypothetical protein
MGAGPRELNLAAIASPQTEVASALTQLQSFHTLSRKTFNLFAI